MPGTRFSLLLLEPGEIYFEDFSVTHARLGAEDAPQQRGRLRLCSKSFFFEPTDTTFPILRIVFATCSSISLAENNALVVSCNQVIEMLANNTVAPYTFLKKPHTLLFDCHYANNQECFQRLSQLHRASSLCPKEQQEMVEAIVHSRHSRVKFDACWLEDLHENILFESSCVQVSPLVSNPGRVVLSSVRLYYQPYNSEPWPVLKIRLSDIDRVVRRRYLLQNTALEISCSKEHCNIKYVFLAFGSQPLCDDLFKKLESKSHPGEGLDVATLQWQHGILSNFEYLLFLNSMADRSFNDLTQYPVVPWVVKDFTSPSLYLNDSAIYRDLSQPIGALNPVRLNQLLDRFNDMPEPRFLYGSHYMAPGFVLFYLARKYPQLVLCLHGGRFDHPDRMFNSMQQTWNNVMHGAADYKELVPEFYDGQGEFLVNYLGIDFGHRSTDGRSVQDVELPPWAGTPREFTSKLRQALESEHVSKNIHRWVDLIFGHLQKGPKAIEANNLFHPLCYEGSVDLASIKDPGTRYMYEIQILEFGQIPRQLFDKPHPPRFAGLIPTPLPVPRVERLAEEEPDAEYHSKYWSKRDLLKLRLKSVVHVHKKAITGTAFIRHDGCAPQVVSVSLDGLLKVCRLDDGKQMLSVSPTECSPLTACMVLPNSNTLVIGTLQNEMVVYQVDCCRLDSVAQVHDDCVTALGIGHDGDELVLASASDDCYVKLWRIHRTGQSADAFRFRRSFDLLAEMEHDSAVTSLDLSPRGDRVVSGTKEGQLQLWGVPSGHLLHVLSGHDDQISAVKFSPDGSKLVSAGCDGLLQVFQVDIDPPQMLAKTGNSNEDFRCLSWDGLSILLGTARGELLLFDLVQFQVIHRLQAHSSGPLNCIAVASSSVDDLAVVTGGQDARLCLWNSSSLAD